MPFLALLLAALLLLPAGASAALPAKGRSYQAHDHTTPGKNWHVQFDVGRRNAHLVSTLVVYAEQCDVTAAAEKVPIADDGSVQASGKLRRGGWEVQGTFTAPDTVTGTFRVFKGRCDTGVLPFTISPLTAGTHNHGPKFPDFSLADVHATRQAIQMRHRVFRARDERFPTYQAARALGFDRFHTRWKRPLVFHLRKSAYVGDDRIFDAWRPESLVYWWPVKGDPILLGMMFRVPSGSRPDYAGPIPIYHQHTTRYGGLGPTQMTHVWLTGDLRSAWSNCLPVPELQAANPAFRYVTPATPGSGPESAPC
ncbi:MAG TPA: hypothetical protein VF533_25290 [Solirubrobacteraceae bacterium]|jgi:hypothetical protein